MRPWPQLWYLLAITPFLTDWVDTGHLPADPREYVTEVVVGILIVLGVRRLHREAAEMRALALTDVLTDLGNRRRFDLDLHREVARAHRLGTPLVLAYVDVNDFKQVNDRFGHDRGDDVLRHVASLLRRGTREGVDLAYRLGGDEFAVLFIGTPPQVCLEALRRATPIGRVDPSLPEVTVSVGLVELRPFEVAGSLVARADAHMYEAKRRPAADGSLHLAAV
jgi:two-component system cell cycle response regulator